VGAPAPTDHSEHAGHATALFRTALWQLSKPIAISSSSTTENLKCAKATDALNTAKIVGAPLTARSMIARLDNTVVTLDSLPVEVDARQDRTRLRADEHSLENEG
jgi:hypothetical protein